MNLAVITSGFLPVPASKGGAVENLIENILQENENSKKVNMTIFSIDDVEAVSSSKRYPSTKFIFIKTNILIKMLDRCIYFIARKILKKNNSHSYRYILQRLSYLNKVSKNIKRNNYDKILLENHPTQFLTLKWRKNYLKYENRYYYHCHNEFPGEYGCHDIIKNTKKIICVSDYIKRTLMKQLNMKEEKFVVLRNGIDQKKFHISMTEEEKVHIRKKFHIREKEKCLLFIGRLVPEKGVLELIKAVKLIQEESFKLLIVGSSLNKMSAKNPYEESLFKEIQNLSDKVIFTGFIDYKEIPKIYHISDIAVLPSIWDDPAPLTVIESLTCGLPIITTNSGGIPEYVNKNCAVILERNEQLIEQLSINIMRLLKDEELCFLMKKESLKQSKNLTVENYYINFLNIMVNGDENEQYG